jgi:hypothetical protein
MDKVHIEAQRLQTWLFSVPRLRAMIGANALLGAVLRYELPELARHGGSKWQTCPAHGQFPRASADDPLTKVDDPYLDAAQGIISRDGGHFEAVFETGGSEFAAAAARLLSTRLPGVRYRIRLNSEEIQGGCCTLPVDLPVFQRCEWSGRGLASYRIPQGNDFPEVAADVMQRHHAAIQAQAGQARDLATLLSNSTSLAQFRRPLELEGVAGDGYIAVVHADGNSVGSRAKGKADDQRAITFHRNRVLLRRATSAAISDVCSPLTSSGSPASDKPLAPIVLLMLGGDDLLAVCRADVALPFVSALCSRLAEIQRESQADDLTLGVGVTIAKYTIPFNRLHGLAESLTSSAKRLVRGMQKPDQSVVDWAVYTTSWLDDPTEIRRRDWVRGSGTDFRVLSRRPLPVVGAGLDSLQGLLNAAGKLNGPRSQFRFLMDQLHRGRTLSDLAFAELSPPARKALEDAEVKAVWYRPGDDGPWLTAILDLLEVYEISRLGRSPENEVLQ